MHSDEFIWRIAGGSGDGIDSTSRNFATALMRSGLHVFTHRHFPSRIRGGHTYVEVRAAPDPVGARADEYDCLLALGDSFARSTDEDAYYDNEQIKPLAENLDDLRDGGIIVYDDGVLDTDAIENFDERAAEHDWQVYPVDLQAIAREHGRDVMRNTAGVGVVAELVGFDVSYIEEIITESMDGDIRDQNLNVLSDAVELVDTELEADHDVAVPDGEHDSQPALLSGSNAIAYGALDAGCRFISGYPMTPWTDVFTIMSQNLPSFDGVSEQVEDEIAAINLAIGASHAGVRAMSGSSGGGFALMSEAVGLAEMTETPLVLLEAMRAGPSTGMPTKPEQADLEHVLYTSQGDSNRIVFAPGTLREAYDQTRLAFELAYEYHLPAIIVYDQKFSGENRTLPADFFDREPTTDPGNVMTEEDLAEAAHDVSGKYERFDVNAETAVPRSVPGQSGGRFLATGNEHVPSGHITEDPEIRTAQMDRRMAKLDAVEDDLAEQSTGLQRHVGPEDATYGIITWGTQQDTVFEAVERLTDQGVSVKGLGVSQLLPFPDEEMIAFLESVDEALVVEMNASGQFRGLIQRELGRFGDQLASLLKYDGEPFTPGEIVDGFEVEILDDRDTLVSTTAKLRHTADD
ncbi:MAG: 2-oxoacid:acceptor oxidoreductase subunit alpha [Salinarchaeum sp.]